ncbi:MULTISPECIES: VWA domain-containing protein [Dyella]|uniref:VWA domain-containing protein n=2 Tax=Dyella TaxID=231454 RepID=A0A4R0YPJ8_9GAMM|nr:MULTISPECIES: VWA domain-containing protein [Dyella]TBR35982.1 VWA domain-containing protein [Dyella terrae]TCI08471.1 VWA domain-containing protein [Dyella soli]
MEQGFHFIRPLWLLLLPAGLFLGWWWQRRNDPLQRWKGLIAPHLLKHLVIGDMGHWHPRPIHFVCAVLVIGGIACAGPTWERDPPPFSEDRAAMVVALDLSPAMNAVDVAPTRLERAKQKIRDLMKERAGGRTGLVVYAGSAHMVLPPTDDASLMELFVSALSTDLMPDKGQNAAAALAMADRLLAAEADPGTIVFITSGFDDAQIPAFQAHAKTSHAQVLLLAVGTTEGGTLVDAHGKMVIGSGGAPEIAKLDEAALKRLSDGAKVPLASLTNDNTDVRWVQREAIHHLEIVHDPNATTRWKESGYILCFPLALIALFWFRRGWMVRWVIVFGVLAPSMLPAPAHAADGTVINWFVTPDQQGRWYFEHGNYEAAAHHFSDPYWKALAMYRWGRFEQAQTIFASLPGPDAAFMAANCHAHRMEFDDALIGYEMALKLRPTFVEAKNNRDLMKALIAEREKNPPEDHPPDEKADEIKEDQEGKRGKEKQAVKSGGVRQVPADVWMRNLSVSPADFLRMKFNIEREGPAPASTVPARSTAQ